MSEDAENRSILHVDMDAFYASVEQHDNRELRGKPVIVGGTGGRGVVAAASYEVRAFGVRSAMPMREALRRCPDAICITPRMQRYREVSDRIFEIFRQFTPVVEGLSLDEAFLDITQSQTLFGTPVEIAKTIKSSILAECGLHASVGVSHNKLLAKIASDHDKPDGLTVITHDNVREMLDPMPVRTLPGIGPETAHKLHAGAIRTLADLRSADSGILDRVFGRFSERVRARAQGIDKRPVISERDDKSISAETTFEHDLEKVADQERHLLALTDRVASRLRAKNLLAGTLQVKIRRADFSTFTRQMALHPPSHDTDQLFVCARELLAEWRAEHPNARLRLLGVGGSNFADSSQMDLFDTGDSPGKVDATVDEVRDRFGGESLTRARTLKKG